MHLSEKLAVWFISRLSSAEKEALLVKISESLFSGMTPAEKSRLIEQMLPHLFAGIDLKEFLPRLLSILWKGSETAAPKDQPGFLDKIAELIPSKLKNRL